MVRKTADGRFDVEIDGEVKAYDRVISTIPIPDMLRLIGEEPKVDIQTRNLISLFYTGVFDRPGNTFFNFSNEASWKRITVFSRFYQPTKQGKDYFTVEVTSDDVSQQQVELAAADFEKHANGVGLFRGSPKLEGSHVSYSAYPIYRRDQSQAVEAEKERLRSYGIDLLGRQGNFEYVISNVVAKRAAELSETIALASSLQSENRAVI